MKLISKLRSPTCVSDSTQAATLLKCKFHDLDHEELHVMYLNKANLPICTELLNIGTLDTCEIDVRRAVKHALDFNAAKILIAHNHPSSSVEPSTADIKRTLEFKKACSYFDILLMDHLIFGKDSYYSFSEETTLPLVKRGKKKHS